MSFAMQSITSDKSHKRQFVAHTNSDEVYGSEDFVSSLDAYTAKLSAKLRMNQSIGQSSKKKHEKQASNAEEASQEIERKVTMMNNALRKQSNVRRSSTIMSKQPIFQRSHTRKGSNFLNRAATANYNALNNNKIEQARYNDDDSK